MNSFKETENMLKNNRYRKMINDFQNTSYKMVERQKKVNSNANSSKLLRKLAPFAMAALVVGSFAFGFNTGRKTAPHNYVGVEYIISQDFYDMADSLYASGYDEEEIIEKLMNAGLSLENAKEVYATTLKKAYEVYRESLDSSDDENNKARVKNQ